MRLILLISTLTLLSYFDSIAQSRWIQQYLDEFNAPALELNLSYDQGYLLTGWITPNYPPYTWLIKTDVNGEIIWQKFLGDPGNSTLGVEQFCLNSYGETYLGGSVLSGSNGNPILIKLNPCGEKEWCSEITTTSNSDSFVDIVNTADGGCAALIYGAFIPLSTYRTGILRFLPDGTLLWQQYYQSTDPGVQGLALSQMIRSPDEGFLLTGWCYYLDPENQSIAWLHPYYIKTDSLGNFEWETVVHKETGDIGGDAFMSLVNPQLDCYYSCISHYYHSDTLYTTRPGIVKLELDGTVSGIYDLVQGNYDNAKILSFDFLNDSLMAGSAGWHNDEEEPQSRVIIFDTLGHIRDSLTLFNDVFLGMTKVTEDHKILVLISNRLSGQYDTYLYKLTQNLQQDTLYTTPFVYDSLCPYQIASDTIVPDDCDVIVGVEEGSRTVRRYEGKKCELEIWPNPAGEILNVVRQLADESGNNSSTFNLQPSISVYDIYGREMISELLSSTQMGGGREGGWTIDVTSLPSGIYFIVIRDERSVIGTGKFVVAR